MLLSKQTDFESYVYRTVHHSDSWRIKDQLDATCYFISFHFLCAKHVSDINIAIIRSLRLFCWITTLVVLFLVRCVLEFQCGWVGVVSVLQAEASACNTDTTPTQPHRNSNTHRTKNNKTNVVIQQNSRKFLISLQHEYHINPTTPKLQHTSNQEQYDQCGNSTE